MLKNQDVSGSFIGGVNNDGGSAAIPSGLLTNNDPAAGIPITVSDGMDTMNTIPSSWADYGFINDTSGVDSTIFGSAKQGYEFVSYNAALMNSGVSGVSADSNVVLVAQITTKGQLSFDLNIEVEVPAFPNPVYVKYVSEFAIGESNSDTLKLSPFLRYPSTCGCTDPEFLEYNPASSCSNTDSCHTRIVFGCTDTLACNYDISANYNLPGLCCYPGNCNDRDIGVVCPSLSIGRSSGRFVDVHPNPVNDELIFRFNSEQEKGYSYSIYNSLGELVLNKSIGKVSGQFTDQIDMSNLISGIYIFKLNSIDISSTVKVIKK
ncbi:MAG: T9SS type A sorting domain-containing protein [Bacteroidetes bacterium]|nr:T9SS type A sorting domain-containing protein [Bacteroidota bacterium]